MRTIIVGAALLVAFRSEALPATAVYAVTTGGALYRSTDGAATWQPVPIQGAPAGVSSPKLAINLNGNIYLTLLTRADVSLVLPLTAVDYIVVAVLAQYLLGEIVTPVRWAGMGLIVAGVGLLSKTY